MVVNAITKQEIFQLVKSYTKKTMGETLTSVPPKNEDDILSHIDSLGFITLIVSLEKALEIEFEDDKISVTAFESQDDFIDYIFAKHANKRQTVITFD